MDGFVEAALRLHSHLIRRHWTGRALIGPDPGVRFNYRIGRFVKSYVAGVTWRDDLYYLQAQAYWILANWALFDRTGDEQYAGIATACAEEMVARQRDDGAWAYPNPEWARRVATVEGTWGSLGLLETYRRTEDPTLLAAAIRWHEFLQGDIGFQREGDTIAVNYFARRPSTRVPNNSTLVLLFLAALAEITEDRRYAESCAGLIAFLRSAQTARGELPYSVPAVAGGPGRTHFQCFQYNAFQCLDLIWYHTLTGDERVRPLIGGVLRFLSGGIAADGHAWYDCANGHRTVSYHTAALAAAFTEAQRLGITDYLDLARRAYAYLLRLQRPDGSLIHSQRDYRLLRDQRSYPRYLAMILYHLLLGAKLTPSSLGKEAAHEEVR